MFYNQPLQVRFGTELRGHLDHPGIGIAPYWDSLDIAVAWVREAGVVHLRDSFERFLVHGGTLTMIVGIDLKNTTQEGLQALLDLEAIGTCETFVHHNEAGSVFHPKVYLFRNSEDARLIVGSNNLTAAGLFSNVEAGLQLDTHLSDQVISGATAIARGEIKTPGDSHRSWLAEKEADGWVWGPVKDPARKEHPCMVPFEELPADQQIKDHLFIGTVLAVFAKEVWP